MDRVRNVSVAHLGNHLIRERKAPNYRLQLTARLLLAGRPQLNWSVDMD